IDSNESARRERATACTAAPPAPRYRDDQMSVSADAEAFIVAEWHAALADAEADDRDYHLIVCAGAAGSGQGRGVAFHASQELSGAADEGGIVVAPEKIAEANDSANLARYRVAVLEDVDPDDGVEVA